MKNLPLNPADLAGTEAVLGLISREAAAALSTVEEGTVMDVLPRPEPLPEPPRVRP